MKQCGKQVPGFWMALGMTESRSGIRSCACRGDVPAAASGGFTLIEILIASVLFALVLLGIHSVFYDALRLHDRDVEAVSATLPVEYALGAMKQDLANLVSPGPDSVMVGPLQTPVLGETFFTIGFEGRQVSPEFYTTSGRVSDSAPWSNIRRVMYCIGTMGKNASGEGSDLVRVEWANLLPVFAEEPQVQKLMSGVRDVAFWFYDGSQWVSYWDSEVQSRPLPYAVKVQIELLEASAPAEEPRTITLVVPVDVDGTTNTVDVFMNDT